MPRLLTTREALSAESRFALEGAEARHGVLLVASLDGYDALAERYSTIGAESVVSTIVAIIFATLRTEDLVARMPEGRFVMLLVGATVEEGRRVGERLCAAIRQHGFQAPDRSSRLRLTMSIGVSGIPDHGKTVDDAFASANAACLRIETRGQDGAGVAPLSHHEPLHRGLAIDRFAGRVEELATLVEWLGSAFHESPRAAGVIGETGLGTATLLRQLEPEARLRGGTFVYATAVERDIPQPFGIWIEVIGALQRTAEGPVEQLDAVRRMLTEPAAAEDRPAGMFQLQNAVIEAIKAAAEARPTVLVLDEMQWADAPSWDVLTRLVAQLTNERLFVCIAAHSERQFVDARERRASLARHAIYGELHLEPLTRDQVKQWIDATFHRQDVGRELLAFVYRHTQGNPFFISQLLRGLVDEGAIWYNGERWEWSPVSELRLPAGVSPLIARRLGRLSASTQAVLTAAAVVGREFTVEMASESGAGSAAVVRLALADGMAAGLLLPTADRRAGGFVFVHERVAGVLVALLSEERRRHLHSAIGRALTGAPGADAGELAMHFDRAGDHGPAFTQALAAAEDALLVFAHPTAEAYLTMAARNAETPAQLADVRSRMAELADFSARYDDVEELCHLALEWYEGQGDARRAIPLRRLRERARMEQGQSARATLDALRAMGVEADALGLEDERVAIMTLESQAHGRLGEATMATSIAAECVETAERLGHDELLAAALLRLGNATLTEPARALPSYERGLEIFTRLRDMRGQARCLSAIGTALQFVGDTERARAAYAQAISIARAAGLSDMLSQASINYGVLSYMKGDYDQAHETYAEALASSAAVRNSEVQVIALFNMANCDRERGRWAVAGEQFSAAHSLAERIGQADIEIGSVAARGLCELELGNAEGAQTAVAWLEQRLRETPGWFRTREFVEALVIRMLAREGRRDEAMDRYRVAVGKADVFDVFTAAWLTANCIPALGGVDPDILGAIRHYSKAVADLGCTDLTKRYAEFAGV